MSNPSELRAWVEELLAEKRAMATEIQSLRERLEIAHGLESSACASMNESAKKIQNLEYWNGSMAKRIKAAEGLCNGPMTHDWDEVRERFSQVAKALETPAEELPF